MPTSPGFGRRPVQLAQTSTEMSDHGRMSLTPWKRRAERGPTSTLPAFRPLAQRLCALTSLFVVGCVRQLPPAPIPPPVAPPVANGPPPAGGNARLVVDVVEGPTGVQRIR